MSETPWIHRRTATRLAMAIYNEPRTRETDALVQAMSEVAHTELRRALEPYRKALLAICAPSGDPELRALWSVFFLAPKESDDVDGDGGDAGGVGAPGAGAGPGDGGPVATAPGAESSAGEAVWEPGDRVWWQAPEGWIDCQIGEIHVLDGERFAVLTDEHGNRLSGPRPVSKLRRYIASDHPASAGPTEAASSAPVFSAEDLRGLKALCSEPGAPLPPRGVQSDGGAFARALGAAITRGQAGKGP